MSLSEDVEFLGKLVGDAVRAKLGMAADRIELVLNGYHVIFRATVGEKTLYVKVYAPSLPSSLGPEIEEEVLRSLPADLAVAVACSGTLHLHDRSVGYLEDMPAFTVFSEAVGKVLDSVTDGQAIFGEALARLHLAEVPVVLRERLSAMSLPRLIDNTMLFFAQPSDDVLMKGIAAVKSLLEAELENRSMHKSIVHGDARPDNLRVGGADVTFFDFEHCFFGPTLFDISTVVWWHGINEAAWRVGDTTAFLQGYARSAPWLGADLECMPMFVLLNEIRTVPLIWRATPQFDPIRETWKQRLQKAVNVYMSNPWDLIPASVRAEVQGFMEA